MQSTSLYYIIAFTISILLLTIAINSKHLSKIARIILLLVANIIFIFSYFYLIPNISDNFSSSVIFITIMAILTGRLIKKIVTLNDPKVIYNQEIFNAWTNDPKNWKMGFIYYNELDHRIFNPKKNSGMGWTVNFANPLSIIAMIGIVVLALLIPSFFGR